MPANPSLDQALPELRAAEGRLRARAQQMGISYALAQYGGLRTQADTNQILNYRLAEYRSAVKTNPRVALIPINTWRPIAPFGRSMHNWGGAFDIVITGAPPGWTKDRALAALGAIAPSVGLRWGGTFPKATLDPPHFELPLSVVETRSRYLQYTNGKGYVSPRSPLDFFRNIFGSFTSAPAPMPIEVEQRSVAPSQIPGVLFIPSRMNILESLGRISAAPLPPVIAPRPVEAADEEQGSDNTNERPVIGTISYAGPSSASMMLAGDEQLGAVSDTPVRTDATDAALLASAQEAKRRQQLKVVGSVIVAGLIIASVGGHRRRRRI